MKKVRLRLSSKTQKLETIKARLGVNKILVKIGIPV